MSEECLVAAERQWLKYLATAQTLPCLIKGTYNVEKMDNGFVNLKKGMELAKLALTQKPSSFEYEPLDAEKLNEEIEEFEKKIVELMEFEAAYLERKELERMQQKIYYGYLDNQDYLLAAEFARDQIN
jgi:DNA mismatch repair ATPase MutL